MRRILIPLLMTTKLYAACAEVEIDFKTEIGLHGPMERVEKDPPECIFEDFMSYDYAFYRATVQDARHPGKPTTAYEIYRRDLLTLIKRHPERTGRWDLYLRLGKLWNEMYIAAEEKDRETAEKKLADIKLEIPAWKALLETFPLRK